MADKTIHTLNARGYIGFEVLKNHFKLSSARMHKEINYLYEETVRIMASKGIAYSKLRNSLTPNLNNEDICFLFDVPSVGESWYGLKIFQDYFPLLNHKSSHSILCGDIIFPDEEMVFESLKEVVVFSKPYRYGHSSDIYCVYISNISAGAIENINTCLHGLPYYIGFAPMSLESSLKIILANCLASGYLKHAKKIICPHEDDRPNSENCNLIMYPFDEYGHVIASIQSMFYSSLLTYKIECPVFPGFEIDAEMALNAIGIDIINIENMDILIDENKLEYLRNEKLGKLEIAGLANLSREFIAAQIKSRITRSYIYNLTYLDEFNTMKFNIMLQFPHAGGGYPARLLSSFEYIPDKNTIRLITLM